MVLLGLVVWQGILGVGCRLVVNCVSIFRLCQIFQNIPYLPFFEFIEVSHVEFDISFFHQLKQLRDAAKRVLPAEFLVFAGDLALRQLRNDIRMR